MSETISSKEQHLLDLVNSLPYEDQYTIIRLMLKMIDYQNAGSNEFSNALLEHDEKHPEENTVAGLNRFMDEWEATHE